MAVLSVDRIPDARASAFSRLNSLNRSSLSRQVSCFAAYSSGRPSFRWVAC